MSFKTKFRLFLVVLFTLMVFIFFKNYSISIDYKNNKSENIEESKNDKISVEECRKLSFQEIQKLKDTNDLYESHQNVYKMLISINNVINNLGLVKDQADDFDDLFRNASKVNVFNELKYKYEILYSNSYKLPITENIITDIKDNFLYKKSKFKDFFILHVNKEIDHKFLEAINLLQSKNFAKAEDIIQTIIDENLKENKDWQKTENAYSIEDLKNISFDIHLLSSIQQLQYDILQILQTQIENDKTMTSSND